MHSSLRLLTTSIIAAMGLSLAGPCSHAVDSRPVDDWININAIVTDCSNGKTRIACTGCNTATRECQTITLQLDGDSDDPIELCRELLSGASIIDNISLNHIHTAMDWQGDADSPPGGCGCGGTKAANTSQLQVFNGQVHSLVPERRHRFRDVTEVSSFGPGVFCHYDISLMLQPNGAGSTVRMFDPGLFMPVNMDDGIYGDARDGIFHDGLRPSQGDRTVSDLRLSTDWAGGGSFLSRIGQIQTARDL